MALPSSFPKSQPTESYAPARISPVPADETDPIPQTIAPPELSPSELFEQQLIHLVEYGRPVPPPSPQ